MRRISPKNHGDVGGEEMKRRFDNEDLKYLNGRINRLFRKFRSFETLFYNWMKKNNEEFDKLNQKEKEGVKLN